MPDTCNIPPLPSRPLGLPVLLRLDGRRCVIVGGGAVALRRAIALLAGQAEVTVIAPRLDPGLHQLTGVTLRQRAYAGGDLAGAWLVVVATDDAAVNAQVAADAAALGVLINRADEPDAGDLTVMAHFRADPLTVAVDSGGGSAAAAVAIRDELQLAFDPDWPTLLAHARPMRRHIQGLPLTPDERAARLRKLTDRDAMGILKRFGPAALADHLARAAAGEPAPARP